MDITHRWALRSLQARRQGQPLLFAILQGGLFPDLRRRSARLLGDLEFDGYGIGGLGVGEPKARTYEALEECTTNLPRDKPRHVLGIGSPEDLLECVAGGGDLFDCVIPTRLGRNGWLLTPTGRLDLRRAALAASPDSPVPGCPCALCGSHSAAYLHHLFKSGSPLAYRLAAIHNLHFLTELLRRAREAILAGMFHAFKTTFLAGWTPSDPEVGRHQKRRYLEAVGRAPNALLG